MPNYPFPLPLFLVGLISVQDYNVWIHVKAWALFKRDRKRGLALALNGSIEQYKLAVHNAVMASGMLDPYTGDTLVWELIKTWEPKRAKTDSEYVKAFYRMPTIDHVDPYAGTLLFEICTWEVNCCKSFLNPREFLDLCSRICEKFQVSGYRLHVIKPNTIPTQPKQESSALISKSFLTSKLLPFLISFFTPPEVYPLPAFLVGICTSAQYRKWLLTRAKQLYKRDKRMKRPCAIGSSRSLYRKAIHLAVCGAGLCDPYTGDLLAWEKIGTWNATKGVDNRDIFRKEFTLLPTVDHIDPAMKNLSFEICSWMINCCKSGRTPQEFAGICGRVHAWVEKSRS